MIVFGATIGALTCFPGGLIAVDISSRKAAGQRSGTIGIASYAGAGLGEFLTGIIIDKTAILENGKTLYDFQHAGVVLDRHRIGFRVTLFLPPPPSSPDAMPSNGRLHSPPQLINR